MSSWECVLIAARPARCPRRAVCLPVLPAGCPSGPPAAVGSHFSRPPLFLLLFLAPSRITEASEFG
eukprot:2532587-Alexandrium_andersonii.AAC.1